jgi:hypothetical protein
MPKQPANHKKNDLQPFTKKTAIELPILVFHFWHRFSRNTAGQAVQRKVPERKVLALIFSRLSLLVIKSVV